MQCAKQPNSAIYDCFQSANAEVDTTNAAYNIDGGYLLHHVVWDRGETFNVILKKKFDTYADTLVIE